VTLIVICAVLTFIPTPLYLCNEGRPVRDADQRGSAIWFVLLGSALFGPEEYRRTIAMLSLAYPVMYLSLSAFVTATRKR
jgi:hypothetical protein